MGSAPGAAVCAAGLTKAFPGKAGERVDALKDLTFTIGGAGITALIGPDGAGKTTLIRLICGLMTKSGGTLTVLGLDPASEATALQAKLGYMPQKFGLYEDLTVGENLALYADLHGIAAAARRQRFPRLLAMTGLAPFTARLAGNLSGGMKQKLGLACTLVRAPSLLLLDEPTVGVDPLSRRELWVILRQLADEDAIPILVSTAYMEEAARCEKVLILHEGRLLAHGTPDAICALAAGRCGRAAPPPGISPRLFQRRLFDDPAHFIDAVPEGGQVRFIRAAEAPLADICAALGTAAEEVPPRLEDAFMLLLHGEAGAPLAGGETPAPAAPPAIAQEVEIEAKNLVKKFGDFTAVDNTSFTVRRGEVFGLLGPNGAGKTTTFRVLCGLLPATSGEIRVAGVDLRRGRIQARQRIGYVAQKFSLYGNLSVMENLRFFGGAYGLRGDVLAGRIAAALAEFQLQGWEESRADDLPGGYKQRLAMAAALLHRPQILFLDEPTSGIDPLARRRFWRRISDLAAGGATIVITTHFMEEAEYCDRILIQDQGRRLALGTPGEIRRQLGQEGAAMNDIFIAIVEAARRGGEG